ncbi:hypothetical protein BHM03_00034363 [Ensete ventricosum]|nr:hypothetical protein BHM03_00034363 [Ensete ventricosum]
MNITQLARRMLSGKVSRWFSWSDFLDSPLHLSEKRGIERVGKSRSGNAHRFRLTPALPVRRHGNRDEEPERRRRRRKRRWTRGGDGVVGAGASPPPLRRGRTTALRLRAPLFYPRSPSQGHPTSSPSFNFVADLLRRCDHAGAGAFARRCGAYPEADAGGGRGKLPRFYCRGGCCLCYQGTTLRLR